MQKGIFRNDIKGIRVIPVGDKYGIELKYEDDQTEILPKSFNSAYEAEIEKRKIFRTE